MNDENHDERPRHGCSYKRSPGRNIYDRGDDYGYNVRANDRRDVDDRLRKTGDEEPTITLDFRRNLSFTPGYVDSLRLLLAREVKFNNLVVFVGEKFSHAFDFSAQLPTHTAIDAKVNRAFSDLGLECVVYDRRLVVQGTPLKEYDGNVIVKLVEPEGLSADFGSRLQIVASTQNSWEMWEDNPPPKNAPYPCANNDRARDVVNTNTKIKILAASVRGRSHAHEGKFRDDYFRIELAKTDAGEQDPLGWHVFTVSDGAGSARYSRRGAQIVCDSIAGVVSKTLNSPVGYGAELTADIRRAIRDRQTYARVVDDPNFLQKQIGRLRLDQFWYSVVDNAQKRLEEEVVERNIVISRANSLASSSGGAQETPVTSRDFNATALCVAIKRYVGGGDKERFHPTWCVLTYWVGDGAIAIFNPNNYPWRAGAYKREAMLLGEPDGGEYAGETRFINSKAENNPKATLRRAGIRVLRDFEAILMATDGVTDPFFEAPGDLSRSDALLAFWNNEFRKEFPGVLDPSLPLATREERLQDGLMFKRKGYHDDRTLLLVLNDRSVEQDNNGLQ